MRHRTSIAASAFHLALVLALIGLQSAPIRACECVEISQKTAYRSAAVVFRGKVVKIQHMILVEVRNPKTGKSEMRPPSSDDQTLVTFQVDGAWKGPVTPTMRVHATAHGSVCPGYVFELDREYVVYAVPLLNPNWKPLQQLVHGAPVYYFPDCPFRIPTNVQQESRLLGKSRKLRREPKAENPQ